MLYDGLTFVGVSEFPTSPVEGQIVYLTQNYLEFEEGLFYWDGEEWIPASGRGSLDAKDSVRITTTGNSIVLSGLQTLDDIILAPGDRVLVKNQNNPILNGIYIASTGTWQRSNDANSNIEVTPGLYTYVEEGKTQKGSSWILKTSEGDLTLGTSPLLFAKFSGVGTVNAGPGLVKSGDALALEVISGLAPGNYNKITIDEHGRAISGSNPNTLAGHGITDAEAKITGAISNITQSDLLADRLVVSDAQGKVKAGALSVARLAEMDQQAQNFDSDLDAKQNTVTGAASTIVSLNLDTEKVVVTDALGKVVASTASSADLGNISGTTGNLQGQIDTKLELAGGALTGPVTQPQAPTGPKELANKEYVDQQVSSVSPMPRSIFSSIPGEVVVFDGGIRWYPPFAITISNVRSFINTPSTIQPVIVDVIKNGAESIFGTDSKPTIAITENDSSDNSVSVTLLPTDYITMSVISAGGEDLSIRIDYTAA